MPAIAMSRIFGFIGNRADLGPRITQAHADLLRVPRDPGTAIGWGIGFYQSGEMLLRRRPLDDHDVLDLAGAAQQIRTDLLLAQVRHPNVGALREENTQPFRYRSWLFAHTGTIEQFEHLRPKLLAAQPEFLRRNVLGETDSEVLFYTFLSYLYDAGHLSNPSVDASHLRVALRSTFELLDRLASEDKSLGHRGNVVIADADCLIAAHRDATMAFSVLEGRRGLEDVLGVDELGSYRALNIEQTRFCVIASEPEVLPQRFVPLPADSMVTLTRSDEPLVEPL